MPLLQGLAPILLVMTVAGLVALPLSRGLRWPARIGIVLATGIVLMIALIVAVLVNGDPSQ